MLKRILSVLSIVPLLVMLIGGSVFAKEDNNPPIIENEENNLILENEENGKKVSIEAVEISEPMEISTFSENGNKIYSQDVTYQIPSLEDIEKFSARNDYGPENHTYVPQYDQTYSCSIIITNYWETQPGTDIDIARMNAVNVKYHVSDSSCWFTYATVGMRTHGVRSDGYRMHDGEFVGDAIDIYQAPRDADATCYQTKNCWIKCDNFGYLTGMFYGKMATTRGGSWIVAPAPEKTTKYF